MMKTFLGKRAVAMLLALVMVLGLVPVVATPKTEAATPDYATLKSTIQGFQYPMGSTVNWPVGNTGAVDGIYLLTSTLTREGYKGYTLNPSMEESTGTSYVGYGTGRSEVIPNTSTNLIGASRDSYSILKGNATSFTIQTINQLYWNFESIANETVYGGLRLRSAVNGNQFYIEKSDGRYHIIRHKTNKWYLHSNSWTFRASIKWAPQSSTNGDENQFWICKVNEEAFYLRDALQDATTYLVSNSTGRFDAEAYENFLTTVQAASDYYASIKRTVWSAIDSSVAKSHKNAVYDAMARLRLSDSTQSYIDIPIEILDFRGDGILFENTDVTPYSLSLGGALASFPENFPGWNNGVSAAGLAYDTLVDGHVVHTKATVDYVAGHLSKHTALVTPGRQMNGIIYNKIKSGTLTYNANGYSDTIAKCKPAIEGGKLHWGDVKTYHDLAYYLLSHMWKESEDIIGTDTLANGTSYATTYNMRVNELSKMRLFKEGGVYSYKSSELSSYNQDGYILNIMNNALGKPSGDPQFQPIDGRGFESSSLYGGFTETPYTNGHNWLFTLHAYGAFVYNQDANLEFNFTGDDDVYFYVNNTLACDIGGMHGAASSGVKLNDLVKNGTLSLKDGQICRFDMFYAERHTVGVNLNFTTNIQIMDESVITEKTQYDPVTGQELPDGSALNTGADVGYTFGLTNRRSGPVKKVQFVDSKLNVTLDGGKKIADLNGQQASELTLTYRTCNMKTGEVYAGEPKSDLSYIEFFTLIEGAVTNLENATPLETGAYAYNPQNETELLDLLALGIPANCKLSIRGFKHTLAAGEFVNSLSTVCTPVQYDPATNTSTELDPISGAASCRCNGMDLTGVTGKPYRVVLDYGKPIEIDLRKVDEFIAGESGISFQYVGSTFDGDHGIVRAKEPLNLIFKAGGEHYDRELGIFHMNDANILRYSPKGFMDKVDPFYAVYKVTMTSQPNFVAYLFNAVEFLPAHTVYYEAEDFKNEITLTKKTTNEDTGAVTTQNSWADENLEKEGTPGGAVQDHVPLGEEVYIPDYRNHPEVLFFGFDNTPEDRERYANTANKDGKHNYDDAANPNANWSYPTARVTGVSINNETGELTIHTKGAYADADFPDARIDTGKDMSDKPLKYNPPDNAVFQIRFKLKNFHQGSQNTETKTALVNMQYQTQALINDNNKWSTGNNWNHYAENIHTDLFNGEHYVVLTQDTWSNFYNSEIKKLRFAFAWIEPKNNVPAEIIIDYIYIGPRELAPVETTYGWDGSYRTDAKLSDGESLFVRGNGVRLPSQTPETAKNYTEMRFSFTGTGFDLISRTGKDQGTCRVEVYKETDLTKAVKTLTVQNKGELELYQIPTVSIRDLEHGTYVVSVMVNAEINSSLEFLKRGNEFYLDAIRIFDPIDVSDGPDAVEEDAVTAYAAYCADSEAYPVIQEVRNILLSAKDFQALDGSTVGAVYVDMVTVPTETIPATDANGETTNEYETVKPDLDVNNHITGTITTYEKAGPKNEVYLGPGQKIAFKLVVKSAELPKRVDVACKAIEGSSTHLSVVAAKNASDVFHGIRTPITSATAQYYSLTIWDKRFEAGTDDDHNPIHYLYVIIENVAASGVLSVTDVKVAYDRKPTLPTGVQPAAYSPESAKRNTTVELPVDYFVDFVVDSHITDVLDSYLDGMNETACNHYPGDWVVEAPAAPGQEGKRVSYCVRCGEILETEILASVSELAFAGASVSLQSDLAIHYKVNESFFTEMGYSDPYVVINDNGTQVILRNYEVKDGKYAFIYKNIAPHRIGDTVTATLYATYDGELYCSASRDYSVADYCYNMLGKTEGIAAYDKLRTLLVDILLYGAKTQEYMSYRLDSLCTDRLTEAQLACGTSECRELVNHRDQAYETIENPTVQWKGAGLNLRESVAIRFKIEAETYEDLEVRITLAGKTYVIKAKDFDHRADGTYVHFKNINAAQMSEPVYVAVYRNGEQVSHTICYSIESYAYSKQNDSIPHLAELVKRMMCYGDSTRAYVGQ